MVEKTITYLVCDGSMNTIINVAVLYSIKTTNLKLNNFNGAGVLHKQ